MDWNWFYSSMAQSVAALVGIFAAFIISKVLQNQSEFSRKSAKLRKLLAVTERHKEALAVRRFRWVSQRLLEYSLDDIDRLMAKNESKDPIEYYRGLDFPRYVPLKDVMEQIEKRIAEFESDADKGPDPIEAEKLTTPYARRVYELAMEEKDVIHNLVVEINQHIRFTELHLSEIDDNPESSGLVTISIMATVLLFFLGVMLPLTFIPFPPGDPRLPSLSQWTFDLLSMKGFLVAATALIFVGIMGVFWYVNRSSIYKDSEVSQLRESTVLENYSPYLKIRRENEDALRAHYNIDEDGEVVDDRHLVIEAREEIVSP
jgi:hypothetical protein